MYTWSKVVWCTNRSNSLNSVPENHNVSNHMIKLLKLRAGEFTLIRYVSNNLFIIFTRVLYEHPLVNTNIYLKWILVLETWSTIHISWRICDCGKIDTLWQTQLQKCAWVMSMETMQYRTRFKKLIFQQSYRIDEGLHRSVLITSQCKFTLMSNYRLY